MALSTGLERVTFSWSGLSVGEDKADKEGEAGNPAGCRCSLTKSAEAAAGQDGTENLELL